MRRDNLNEPVHHLHRTRGSFDREASGDAVAIPGPVARIAPIAIGALALFAVGLLARGGGARR
jgi:hypothetical protein